MRSFLYKLARLLGDVKAVSSGSPKRIAKRVVNKQLGRRLYPKGWLR